MSIQSLENGKVLRAYCKLLGREGVAKLIKQIAKSIAEGDGEEYQSTLKKAGMIRALALGAQVDTYWGDKQSIGFQMMVEEAHRHTK